MQFVEARFCGFVYEGSAQELIKGCILSTVLTLDHMGSWLRVVPWSIRFNAPPDLRQWEWGV